MKLRNAEVDEEEVFDTEEITVMVDEYSPAALVHFLNNQLKRKLLNKLVYKFTTALIDAQSLKVSQTESGIDIDPNLASFKLLWFCAHHAQEVEQCKSKSKG